MTGLIRGVEVAVSRPLAPSLDAHGNAAAAELVTEAVGNVIPQPGGTSDLDASRPRGASAAMTFHFPKGYGKSLKGCLIAYGGRSYRVIGDPRPYAAGLCPGGHDMPVEAEAVDG